MPGHGAGMPMGLLPFGPLTFIVTAVVIVIPFWAIFSKAGHSKWLSLLMIVPLVNIVTLYWLAFSSWPSLQNRR